MKNLIVKMWNGMEEDKKTMTMWTAAMVFGLGLLALEGVIITLLERGF